MKQPSPWLPPPPQLREQVEAIVVTGDQVRLRLREPGENSTRRGKPQAADQAQIPGSRLDISKFTRWQLSDGNLVRMVNWGPPTDPNSKRRCSQQCCRPRAFGGVVPTARRPPTGGDQLSMVRRLHPDFPGRGNCAQVGSGRAHVLGDRGPISDAGRRLPTRVVRAAARPARTAVRAQARARAAKERASPRQAGRAKMVRADPIPAPEAPGRLTRQGRQRMGPNARCELYS